MNMWRINLRSGEGRAGHAARNHGVFPDRENKILCICQSDRMKSVGLGHEMYKLALGSIHAFDDGLLYAIGSLVNLIFMGVQW
jgi:hypothetical protein